VKAIRLTQGKVALVDDEDFDAVSKFKWYAQREHKSTDLWYARGKVRMPNGKSKLVLMHRFILGALHGQRTDHWDRNGLNNQRDNLRIATATQNGGNRKPNAGPNRSSRYKGVGNLYRGAHSWQAKIVVGGQQKYLGVFLTEEDAARAYNKAALDIFGEFARLNVIGGGE